jgi:hypothetical protein
MSEETQAATTEEPLKFKVDDYYTGKCDEVRVVKKGDKMVLEFGFTIGADFHDYSGCFLGSDKIGKDGMTNDERMKRDLMAFGCEKAKLDDGNIMAHIRGVMIGKEIEVQAGEYKGNVQFSGCRVPGQQRGPVVVITENPFGTKSAPAAPAGAGMF